MEIPEMPETVTVVAKRKIAGVTMPVCRILHRPRRRRHPLLLLHLLHRRCRHQNNGDNPTNAAEESRVGRL